MVVARVNDSDERQARRRAADFPFLFDLHVWEVDPEDMTGIRVGDVEPLADDDHGGAANLTRLYQLHRLDQVTIVCVERVQHAVRSQHEESLAIGRECCTHSRFAEDSSEFA